MSSNQTRVNTLFTSAGRRVELLRAFKNSYKKLNLSGNVIALDIDPLAPALRIADRPFIVPPMSSPDYLPTLIEICKREQVNIIFPLVDPDIPLLARARSEISSTGARLAVVPAAAAAIAEDKWLTLQFFDSIGVPRPKSWLPHQIDPATVQFPLFIKPRRGSAAKQTFEIRNPSELKFFSNYVTAPLVQEFLPGPEITNDVICDLESSVLTIVSRQRIEVRWGEVAKGVTIHNHEIVEECIKIAHNLPAIGPITVQCMLKDDRPYFTEINARLGGGAPLAISAGADFPTWLLARAANLPLESAPIGAYQAGYYMTRFDDSLFLSEASLRKMASCLLEAPLPA